MASRKIPDEVQKIFDKYTKNYLIRRLKRDEATTMLEEEFNLSAQEADVMFDVFDKDRNNELSLWEFHQFYTCMGYDAKNTIDLFQKIEKDHSGTVDIEKCWDTVKTMKTSTGKNLEDKDVELLLKSTAGTDRCIDLYKFISLITRVKFFRG